jgi:hypothetical protein
MISRSWRPGVLPAAFFAAMVSQSAAFMPPGLMIGRASSARFSSLAAISHRPSNFVHARGTGAVRSLRGGAIELQASFLDGFTVNDIDGKQVDLGKTYGDVPAVLVVNLASK